MLNYNRKNRICITIVEPGDSSTRGRDSGSGWKCMRPRTTPTSQSSRQPSSRPSWMIPCQWTGRQKCQTGTPGISGQTSHSRCHLLSASWWSSTKAGFKRCKLQYRVHPNRCICPIRSTGCTYCHFHYENDRFITKLVLV